jgi:hypothetical protein
MPIQLHPTVHVARCARCAVCGHADHGAKEEHSPDFVSACLPPRYNLLPSLVRRSVCVSVRLCLPDTSRLPTRLGFLWQTNGFDGGAMCSLFVLAIGGLW